MKESSAGKSYRVVLYRERFSITFLRNGKRQIHGLWMTEQIPIAPLQNAWKTEQITMAPLRMHG